MEKGEGKPTAADLAVINLTAAGYIVGEEVSPKSIEPRELVLVLKHEGKELHRAPGSDCWKGAWETGLWLANFAHRQGVNLKPGQVIICGALGTIQPGETGAYHFDAGALGQVFFEVSAESVKSQ